MKKIFRIRKRKDFLRIARFGCYFRADSFFIQAGFNGLGNYRIGFTASKKVGNAVIRNRCKRRMKAAADIVLPNFGISGIDYVVIAKTKISTVRWDVLLEQIEKAFMIINEKIGKCKHFL